MRTTQLQPTLTLSKDVKDGDIIWMPTVEHFTSSNLTCFVRFINERYDASIPIGDQTTLHEWSITHPSTFWYALSRFLDFPFDPLPKVTNVISNRSSSLYRNLPSLVNVDWFAGCTTNFAQLFLRHASGSLADKPAIISITENRAFRSVLTFRQLERRVVALAVALEKFVNKGDHVGAILGNGENAVIILLATAAIGGVFSCCSSDFGEDAIVSRFVQTSPTVLFYAPSYVYKGTTYDIHNKVNNVCHRLSCIKLVVSTGTTKNTKTLQCLRNGVESCDMHALEAKYKHNDRIFESKKMTMNDPVVTMFSSGTTGRPKCLVQGTGILLNQMKEHSLHINITNKSIVYYYTSTGWMMFNWSIVALTLGASVILYDGAAHPPNNEFIITDIMKDEKVTHFGSGAALLRSLSLQSAKCNKIEKSGFSLEMVMATGSPSTKEHFEFVYNFFGPHVQYVSMSGGTDINGCFVLGTPWKPVRLSWIQCIGLGMDVDVLNDQGISMKGKTGELVCKNSCPCMPLYFLGDDIDKCESYRKAYFQSFGDHIWNHGDFAEITSAGDVIISGRSDATLNPGGIRIGTADIYHVVETLQFLQDSLVTDVTLENSSSMVVMVLFVVLRNPQMKINNSQINEIRKVISTKLSPKHVPAVVLQVSQIPYTFSGKKCEIHAKKILCGERINNTEAIKNPGAFHEIAMVFRHFRVSKKQRMSKL